MTIILEKNTVFKTFYDKKDWYRHFEVRFGQFGDILLGYVMLGKEVFPKSFD